ncbi:MAG: hypothetical protein M1821_000638 [Bathelium mastoideum]|nr:MAG: hypothetical protein M1821_000638 [Bathelium mastoideum]
MPATPASAPLLNQPIQTVSQDPGISIIPFSSVQAPENSDKAKDPHLASGLVPDSHVSSTTDPSSNLDPANSDPPSSKARSSALVSTGPSEVASNPPKANFGSGIGGMIGSLLDSKTSRSTVPHPDADDPQTLASTSSSIDTSATGELDGAKRPDPSGPLGDPVAFHDIGGNFVTFTSSVSDGGKADPGSAGAHRGGNGDRITKSDHAKSGAMDSEGFPGQKADGPATADDTGSIAFSHLANPEPTSVAVPTTSVAGAIFTAVGHTYVALQTDLSSQDGQVIISSASSLVTLSISGTAATFGKQIVSAATSGLVVGSNTHTYSAMDPGLFPLKSELVKTNRVGSTISEAPYGASFTGDVALFTISGAAYTAFGYNQPGHKGKIILSEGSSRVTSSQSGSGTVFHGKFISVATNGLVIGSSTEQFTSATMAAIAPFTVSSNAYTAFREDDPGHTNVAVVPVGSVFITLTPGGPDATLNGQIISAAPNGLVVGSRTELYRTVGGPPASADPAERSNKLVSSFTVRGTGYQAFQTSALDHSDEVVIPLTSQTLTLFPGGPPVTLDGQVVSATKDGLVIETSTEAFRTNTSTKSESPIATNAGQSSNGGPVESSAGLTMPPGLQPLSSAGKIEVSMRKLFLKSTSIYLPYSRHRSMDGLSSAASIIAVIDISAKIISLCSQYFSAVKKAKNDIERVQRKLGDIKHILEMIKQLLDKQETTRLSTTHDLLDSISRCLRELQDLEVTLEPEPGNTRRVTGGNGVRALKWPFTSKQVNKVVSSLEKYEQTFVLALQVDQAILLSDLGDKLDLAQVPIATGASHDSHAEEHNARCLANTRTALLDEIKNWANEKDGELLFWLSGMAGTGKSTIARTITQLLSINGQLGASFFFKRGESERGNASRFFTTIAIDLAAREPGMLPSMRNVLAQDSDISTKALKDQFEKLILGPLLGIKQARLRARARVVVVDALDECEQEQDIRVILQLLARTKGIQPVPLRVVVTSRPELPIRLGFKEMPNGTYQDLVLHEVARSTIEHDIKLFLEHELGIIQKERMLSSDWPAEHEISALVELAVPLFIYAATVCRHIGTRGRNPKKSLNKVLEYQKSNFSQLERTYLPILEQLLLEQEEDEKTWLYAFLELVGSIVVLKSPLSIASLACLLQISEEDVQCTLDSLHSVLSVPNNKEVPIRPLHLSFREFLIDPEKRGRSPFWVDEKSTHKQLASHCLELMSGPSGLRQNICSLSGPEALRSGIDEETVASSLSPPLQYACCHWVDHLEQSQQNIIDGDMTHLFLQKHLLHWFEALILVREWNRRVQLLDSLLVLVDPSASDVSSFLQDAKRFLRPYDFVRGALADYPLQIYCSPLTFAPETSLIRQTFEDQALLWIEMVSERERDWDSTLEDHSGSVKSAVSLPSKQLGVMAVAFSSDGQLAASASGDKTIRLWQAATGTCHSILKGHSRWVTAVAFSPDGQLLASASGDETIRLWKTATGTCHNILKGHSLWVGTVTFSPDGQLVASASSDRTIRLWQAATGTCSKILKGHSLWIGAVAFSPDRRLVASASGDRTIRLWWAATGTCDKILKGHGNWVEAVAFSPDGKFVASASVDKTIRLWGAATGTCHSVLHVYSCWVTTVAFSLDGQCLYTNGGDIPLPPLSLASLSPQNVQFSRVSIQDEWISLNHQNILWLPPNYRPHRSAIHKDLICLGHSNSRVTFLKIRHLNDSHTVRKQTDGGHEWYELHKVD